MRDIDIRRALRCVLAERFADDPDTRIIEELGLCQGEVRIDVAVVNGALHGYEIKSERDTLRRLPAQSAVYNQIFDTVTIVIGPRYESLIRDHVPPWWGITVARQVGNDTVLDEVQAACRNSDVTASSLVQLLWRDEALALLESQGLADGMRSKPRRQMWKRLVEYLDTRELAEEVRTRIKAREGWRADE